MHRITQNILSTTEQHAKNFFFQCTNKPSTNTIVVMIVRGKHQLFEEYIVTFFYKIVF